MADQAGVDWRVIVTAVWSRRTWLCVGHLAAGAALWLLPAAVVTASLGEVLRKRPDSPPVHKILRLSESLVVLLLALLILFALTSRFTAWQRARFRAILGVDLAPFAPTPAGWSRRRQLFHAAVARRTWRQLRYHLLGGAFATVAAVISLTGLFAGGSSIIVALGRSRMHVSPKATVALIIGITAFLVAPWVARGATVIDTAMARALLQPGTAEVLARRVESLSASRAGAIDAADAERRRIERNLHDGTQQRLVSLAMNLGLTRDAVRDAPPEVRDAVAAAHEEAKLALSELRDFIRGLHPAVLDELGLDAALSGIAARSPVPVRLSVELERRPPAVVETVAYFVVSEALANAARHATATRVRVEVCENGDELLLSVIDDGRGGADPALGTGLRGLAQRVDSVDGTLHIASPPGGPTAITVRLPCAS